MKNQKVVLFKTPIMTSLPPTSHLGTYRSYRDKCAFTSKWLGRGKVPFFEGTPGNRSSRDGVGPVAQRIRVRGYEPRCRGFESLLAHNRPKREVPFPLGVGKS